LSSAYNNIRDKNSEVTANKFDAYLRKLNKEEKIEITKNLKSGLSENSCQEVDRFLERQAYIFRHNTRYSSGFFCI
jgi:CTP-dependent riboflavin kinase